MVGDGLLHLLGVKHVHVLAHHAQGMLVVHVEVRGGRALVALLGGDYDNAVGCARTVDGGGGGVLEDGEALDVVRVDGRQGVAGAAHAVIADGKAVHDDEG